jgi:subtilase family serine protease
MGRRSLRAAGLAVALVLGAVPAAPAAVPEAHATRVGPAPAAWSLRLVLPLRADLGGLQRFALAVSTPGSPEQGAYESIADLARRFGASPATRRRVLSYLRRAGARDVGIDATGLFADATMSAGLAQRLFATPLAQFRSDRGSRFVAPAAASAPVHLPGPLGGLVLGVVGLSTQPLVSAPAIGRVARRGRAAADGASQRSSALPRSGTPRGCVAGVSAGGFTPNQYLTAYGYDSLHNSGISGQGERVALIEIDGYKSSDVRTFARCFGLPNPAVSGIGVGVRKPLPAGGEATLDIEVLAAAAPRLKSIDVYEAMPSAASTLQALTAPLHARAKPQVISVSLGLCEAALEQSVGSAGIDAAEGALQMAAASGTTFLAASGDQGSADCTGSGGAPLHFVAVNYPASSWWVTGVGGTNLMLSAANQIVSQIVWNDTSDQPGSAGGGGSSDLFRRPSYQKGIVRSDSRAVPDVSMLADLAPGDAIYCSAPGDCINMVSGNPWQAVGGTSAATPLLAGGFALVDQELRDQRRQDLGLANPLLYSEARSSAAASVFYDVTAIGNDVGPDIPGNGQLLGCCSAVPGYDTASGWGSVNVAGFAAVAVGTEPRIVDAGLSLPAHQSPVRRREILATVSCSGPCLMGAFADVGIGRSPPFEVDSNVFRLRAKGNETIALRFSAAQLRRLRSALARHVRVAATVHGVLFDPTVYAVLPDSGGSIQRQTGAKSLRIGS